MATSLVLMWRQEAIQSVTTCWVRVAVGVNTDLAGAETVVGGRIHAGVAGSVSSNIVAFIYV